MATRMSDLPSELVADEIFSRIPITSLRVVRSTCKLWESLSKNWSLGKKASPRQQFVGFMTINSKICSLRVNDVEVDLSIGQVKLLSELEISKVFQCEGLLLCVMKGNWGLSGLLVWNPYLGQTRCIKPRIEFRSQVMYALGYEYDKKMNKCNHKILRFSDYYHNEIYDLSSDSWRVLNDAPDSRVKHHQHCVSLKGNIYFIAQEKIGYELQVFLVCFDSTTERFGPRLPLPSHSAIGNIVTLSCVREEQLAVLYQAWSSLEIWVTSDIKHNTLLWTMFLKVNIRPLTLVMYLHPCEHVSFFIDEEEKVAVVFGYNVKNSKFPAFIIGDDGYFKSVSLGREAPSLWNPSLHSPGYCPPLFCSSSYLPSLVQIK